MPDRDSNERKPFWSSLGGILTGIAAVITAFGTIYQLTRDPNPPETGENEEAVENCGEINWNPDKSFETCYVAQKTFSIPLSTKISKIEGNIYIYVNRRRLADKNGIANYNENLPGHIQVIIPIMKGNTMIGSADEIIYSTNQGKICSIKDLYETTGHLKDMKVAYALNLESDCKSQDGKCYATIIESGTRVSVVLNELEIVLGKDCPGKPR